MPYANGERIAGQHEMDARVRRGLRRVDAHDAGVGQRRPQQLAVQHARQDDVVREARLAGDLGAAVHAAPRAPDDGVWSALIAWSLPADGRLDGLEDLQVSRAAAEVAGERLANPLARRRGVAVEQRLGRDENPRRAVAALRAAEVGERLLQRMQPAIRGEPFDRRHASAGVVDREGQTREDGFAVDEHRAGAALAELAAVLGAGELQVFAQHLEQRLVAVDEHVHALAVHEQLESCVDEARVDVAHVSAFHS